MGGRRYWELNSPHGHDAFLKEFDRLDTVLREGIGTNTARSLEPAGRFHRAQAGPQLTLRAAPFFLTRHPRRPRAAAPLNPRTAQYPYPAEETGWGGVCAHGTSRRGRTLDHRQRNHEPDRQQRLKEPTREWGFTTRQVHAGAGP